MNKVMLIKNNAILLLISSILLMCIGFIIVGCGTSPQLKIYDQNAGSHALDLTDCPNAPCSVAYNSGTAPTRKFSDSDGTNGVAITLEAWIKPTATSTKVVLTRGGARGATLKVTGASPTTVTPIFEIRRVVASASGSGNPPTSTAAYAVSGTAITINSWTHIAGILTNQNHTTVHSSVTCAGGADADARDDSWHIDIYENGNISACAATFGGNTNAGDADGTTAVNAFAHEPESFVASINLLGIIDEARIWNSDREQFLNECMSQELGTSGNCNFKNNIILYSYFNAEKGFTVADRSGIFSGTKEHPDPSNAGEFLHWETGWTTDTPF